MANNMLIYVILLKLKKHINFTSFLFNLFVKEFVLFFSVRKQSI